jgi:hypothetical protein
VSLTGVHVAVCWRHVAGKTRTKDKYRVVYSDHQRLELEKEFHYSRYITIRRKAELAANLGLSERQASNRHCPFMTLHVQYRCISSPLSAANLLQENADHILTTPF